jgi:hypothetical protein
MATGGESMIVHTQIVEAPGVSLEDMKKRFENNATLGHTIVVKYFKKDNITCFHVFAVEVHKEDHSDRPLAPVLKFPTEISSE